MITGRRYAFLLLGALALALVGCGGGEKPAAGDPTRYPLVTEVEPEFQRSVTTASGSIVRRPVKPMAYETQPSETCERAVATFHDGSTPAKRAIVIPPAPGLRASALSKRKIQIEWTFQSLPSDCRPEYLLLAVLANDEPNATPTTKQFKLDGVSGSAQLSYPDFLPVPDVARASAVTEKNKRSRTVSVLIRR